MIRKFLRVFRVAVIVGLTLGAVAFVVVWVVQAYPEAAFQWGSENGRLHVLQAPPGSMISLHFGDKRQVGRGCQARVLWDHELDLAICPDRVVVDYLNRVEDLRGVTSRRGGFRNFGWYKTIDGRGCGGGPCVERGVYLPNYLVLVAMVAYPALVFMRSPARRRHHRRHKRGLCVGCGYDLTGNVTGVCSECGAAIDPKQAEATG